MTAASPGVVALFQVLFVGGKYNEDDEDDEEDYDEVKMLVFLPIIILRLTNTLSLTRNTSTHLSPSLPKSKSIKI